MDARATFLLTFARQHERWEALVTLLESRLELEDEEHVLAALHFELGELKRDHVERD